MLGEVVVYDERVFALVHEVLGERATRVRRDVLQRRGVARGRREHAGIRQCAAPAQRFHRLRDGAGLLTDGDVYAHHILALLVEDGVHRDGGLARLAVAYDQLTLTAAYGEHGVYREYARFHGLVDGLTIDDAGRGRFHGVVTRRRDVAQAVYGLAQRVDHAAEEGVAHGHARRPARATHGAALLDGRVVAEKYAADAVGTQVLNHALRAALEHEYLAVLGAVQTGERRDAVAHADDRAHFGAFAGERELIQLFFEQRDYLVGGAALRRQPRFELFDAALYAPIVYVRAHLQFETATQRGILDDLQLALAVLGAQKVQKTSLTRFVGRGHAEKPCHRYVVLILFHFSSPRATMSRKLS